MKKLLMLAAVAATTVTGPAFGHHLQNLDTPYASRGACEAAVADFNNDDWEMLLDLFPDYFSSQGEVASFLTRAFPCELSATDGQWYIQNRYGQVLHSDWYLRRQ
jgi:hypothetical protein